jgi:CrcB protein
VRTAELDSVASTGPIDDGTDVGDLRGLPIDPDLEAATPRWPRIDPRIVLAVFVGGIFGGLARYGIGQAAAPASGGFPWDIFAINLAGGFGLAVLVVFVVEVLPPTKYVRPALGTGFLGAFTTFSSLVVASDHLTAHGHPGTAALYLAASLVGGLVAATAGMALGRTIGRRR